MENSQTVDAGLIYDNNQKLVSLKITNNTNMDFSGNFIAEDSSTSILYSSCNNTKINSSCILKILINASELTEATHLKQFSIKEGLETKFFFFLQIEKRKSNTIESVVINPNNLNLGVINLKSSIIRSVIITNQGNTPINKNINHSSKIIKILDKCSGVVLLPKKNCIIKVSFNSNEIGILNESISFGENSINVVGSVENSQIPSSSVSLLFQNNVILDNANLGVMLENKEQLLTFQLKNLSRKIETVSNIFTTAPLQVVNHNCSVLNYSNSCWIKVVLKTNSISPVKMTINFQDHIKEYNLNYSFSTNNIICNLQNALDYGVLSIDNVATVSGTLGSGCQIESCNNGYHLEENVCKSNTKSCITDNGTGVQSWNGINYGTCLATHCSNDFHLENNLCLSNTRNCSLPNGQGIQSWIGADYSSCVATSCDEGYDIDGTACRLTKYHLFVLDGGINMTGHYDISSSDTNNCNNVNYSSRILQYSRGINMNNGLCPYNSGTNQSYVQAKLPLQFSTAFNPSTGYLNSFALRFANRYLSLIHPNDKIVLIPVAQSDHRFFAGTAGIASSQGIEAVTVANRVINHFGVAGELKGILYQGGESETSSTFFSKNLGTVISDYFNHLRNNISGASNTPILLGSYCQTYLNANPINGNYSNNNILNIQGYLTNVQAINLTSYSCSPTTTYFSLVNHNNIGDAFFNAYINPTGFNSVIKEIPITNISIDQNKAIANQSNYGIATISISGGVPPYSISTSNPNFSISGNTLMVNNLSIGTHQNIITVVDKNGTSYNQNLPVEAISPSYSFQSFLPVSNSVYEASQSSSGSFLNFESNWSYSTYLYVGNNGVIPNLGLFNSINTSNTKFKGIRIVTDANNQITATYQDDMSAQFTANSRQYTGIFFKFSSFERLENNRWNHIVVTYNPSLSLNARITIYINGVRSTVSSTGSSPTGHVFSINNDTPVRMFLDPSIGTSITSHFDDTAFWNYTMSQSNVTELYNEGNPLSHSNLSNLIHYYNFEGSNPLIIEDVINNINFNKTPSSGTGSYINFVNAK